MQLVKALLALILLTGSAQVVAQVRASHLMQRPASLVPRLILPASSQWVPVLVQRVVDGDTYDVDTGRGRARLRLLGADAPEAGQPFGRQATDSVVRALRGRAVLAQAQGRDEFGRNLAAVRLRPVAFRRSGPVALDSLLVACGWAWAYPPAPTRAGRAAEQQRAQALRRGLWKCGVQAPIEPAVWRGLTTERRRGYWGSCSW